MDDAAIVALLSGIEPSVGEIPHPPFMAALPAAPVVAAGADLDAVDAWVKARGGWTHRTPAHLAGPDGERAPLFFIVPKGHLSGASPPARAAPAPARAASQYASGAPSPGGVPSPAPVPSAAPGDRPAPGLSGAGVMTFVATSDLAAARAFYERGLGLRFTGQSPIACMFDCGPTTLRVVLVEQPVIAPYTVLGWTVTDIATTIADLVARGIDFAEFDGMQQDERGIWKAPGGALIAWFKDPDGNVLSLTQL